MSPGFLDPFIREHLAQKRDAFREDTPPPDASVAVERATRYIHDHLYEEELTVARTLDACDIQSTTFSQRFRLQVGRTPHQYIQHRRIEAAQALLNQGVENLFVVGVSVGYACYRTFLRNFKAIVGDPPSEYQANDSDS